MTGAAPQRLFLAVALDDDTRTGLVSHLERNGGALIPGRHVVPANWHLTLRFLGKCAPEQRDRLVHYVDEQLERGPFRVRFGGVGGFPRIARATVAWLAVEAGAQRLEQIAAVCEEAAQVAGYFPEERPFHPHLTLSRIRPPEDLGPAVDGFEPFAGALHVDAVVLYESVLRRGPAEYRVVERFAL
ncbi:MAG: RNA 2',3'-cyclic phosphodiesterase [Acidimicrobiia bacterium]